MTAATLPLVAQPLGSDLGARVAAAACALALLRRIEPALPGHVPTRVAKRGLSLPRSVAAARALKVNTPRVGATAGPHRQRRSVVAPRPHSLAPRQLTGGVVRKWRDASESESERSRSAIASLGARTTAHSGHRQQNVDEHTRSRCVRGKDLALQAPVDRGAAAVLNPGPRQSKATGQSGAGVAAADRLAANASHRRKRRRQRLLRTTRVPQCTRRTR